MDRSMELMGLTHHCIQMLSKAADLQRMDVNDFWNRHLTHDHRWSDVRRYSPAADSQTLAKLKRGQTIAEEDLLDLIEKLKFWLPL